MLIIFDKDGTLVESIDGRPANILEEHKLLPNVVEKCAQLKAEGHMLGIASNQGGVAFGYMRYNAAKALMLHLTEQIGADYMMFCPYHPHGSIKRYARESLCRKPNPGMIFEIARRAKMDDPQQILFVGDLETDQAAAARAGVQFAWAKDFFGWV